MISSSPVSPVCSSSHTLPQLLTKPKTASDLKEVRVATSAYGKHLFGKVNLPDSTSYFMFRAFIPGGAETAKLHCIHMAEIEGKDGEKTFKAIWGPDDKLEWFDE